MKVLCPFCDARARLVTERRHVEADDGTQVSFTDKLHECVDCGERFYTQAQSMDSCRNHAAALREHEHLLTPADIRGIRGRFALTQADLEALLGVGAKTVVRWERGTVCQSRAVDLLLRILDSSGPSVLERAKKRSVGRTDATGPSPAVAERRPRYRARTKARRRK